jgi:tetratricopeptide (TPR) repeat protein
MKQFYILLFFMTLKFTVFGVNYNIENQDTSEVVKLNKQAYLIRLSNPQETYNNAKKALIIAQELNYVDGIGESYRQMGIGNFYLNQPEIAIENYLNSLHYFARINNLHGQAKVYNNIGNLYRDNDYDQSLFYLQKSLDIAKKVEDNQLIASLYLNIGNVYLRKKSFNQALQFYNKSNVMFQASKDSVNIIKCLQNRGVIYYNLGVYDQALSLLVEANKLARAKDLNELVASIDLTLASLYIAQSRFVEAEKIVSEGLHYSNLIQDEKLQYDYKFTSYQLEYKRKNYESALHFLQEITRQDSISHKLNESTRISLMAAQFRQQEKERETELLLSRQKYDRIKFWGATAVSGLLLIVVAMLIGNVKRKNKTNTRLTELNGEVSRQKDNLDRINHHLEEIIDERTKDLQIKNKKLSEYSSYLSHQIRGPIATLKGLMNLEKEGLVGEKECISMMDKCVSEIDEKIIDMSDMLHDPERTEI